jgi:uncharacterized protein
MRADRPGRDARPGRDDDLTGGGSMHTFKVVVAGPMGVGKTTFIDAISELQTVTTEARISDGSGVTADKTSTTVAVDFGRITVLDDIELYLFGTPGQDRFDYMWDVAATGMLGFILLVDCSRPDLLPETRRILDHFRALGPAPFVVAANKGRSWEHDRRWVVDELGLTERDRVVRTDARDRIAVRETLVALLEGVLAALDSAA